MNAQSEHMYGRYRDALVRLGFVISPRYADELIVGHAVLTVHNTDSNCDVTITARPEFIGDGDNRMIENVCLDIEVEFHRYDYLHVPFDMFLELTNHKFDTMVHMLDATRMKVQLIMNQVEQEHHKTEIEMYKLLFTPERAQ